MIKNEYVHRVNNVIDYIESRLEFEFNLDELAGVSNFSKFHFVRVFRGITGETPFELILRLRLEKAASLLIRGNKSVSEIAFECGFKSLPVFSKNFKAYYKASASSFRKSNLNKNNSNFNKVTNTYKSYFYNPLRFGDAPNNKEGIEIRKFEEESVIYLRHHGPYSGNADVFGHLFHRLVSWAGAKGLLESKEVKKFIVYHDDLDIADEAKLRTSVCLSAPKNTKVDSVVGKMTIQKGQYVVARFNVKAEQIKTSWDWLMGYWFPTSGFQPDDKVCFEQYHAASDDGIFTLDICIPVKRLN
ncbi:MAG: AraC family transcriptional regulator [Bacteroidota bacterium]